MATNNRRPLPYDATTTGSLECECPFCENNVCHRDGTGPVPPPLKVPPYCCGSLLPAQLRPGGIFRLLKEADNQV